MCSPNSIPPPKMTLQKFLRHLRTVKRCQLPNPFLNPTTKIADTIITTLLTTATHASATQPIPTTILSNLTPNLVYLILSDPHLNTPKCFDFFKFLIKYQSLITFKLNLDTHLALICRLVKSRKFTEAESVLFTLLFSENQRYPFSEIASFIRNSEINVNIAAKIFNLMLKVFSENYRFLEVIEAFNYMKRNGVDINERTCTIHLIELIRCDLLELAINFFYRMVDSGLEVSVFSLTVVVDGLCKCGHIKGSRELVEEMTNRGIKPNLITYNTLVDACTKRWNFEELDKVILLMKKEGAEFSVETYKFLIDGFTSSGRIEDAEKTVLEMHDEGFKVDTHMYNLVVNGFCRLGNMEGAFSFFCKMKERKACPNFDTYWLLVIGLCKVGEIKAAKELVDKMQGKGFDLESGAFDILVDGYCREGMIDAAIQLLKMMEKKEMILVSPVYEMIVSSLCKLNRMEQAELLLNTLVKRDMMSEVSNFVSLIKSSGHQRCLPEEVETDTRSDSDLYSDLIIILQDRKGM